MCNSILKISAELNNSNTGFWGHAYMDSSEGQAWSWCVGYGQTIMDHAFSTWTWILSPLSHTYSCDVLAGGLRNNCLIESRKLRQEPDIIQSGDIFLNVRVGGKDRTRTGIILGREGDRIHAKEDSTTSGYARVKDYNTYFCFYYKLK